MLTMNPRNQKREIPLILDVDGLRKRKSFFED
jgi:hypothetical protein